ncbi:uncharacterized protein BO87DRAFT_133579 [Aspergillus neoniger CBS 115656]|uniref:Uncharacterized protein n=1 Tax=Aspergillus neoniger (strain CBS 115656) TaxID=1448310 RepID=A0A318YXC7_ASPNB|nr:hypothetical protein BO87DRAFT_133579 [Aspergillus neoniger CBS 115656]PYH38834.1 hypothetical protein BO87DRAFT_133579 [Aspergillus neoniger CBS 115656]
MSHLGLMETALIVVLFCLFARYAPWHVGLSEAWTSVHGLGSLPASPSPVSDLSLVWTVPASLFYLHTSFSFFQLHG